MLIIMSTVGKRIKELRKAIGLRTQADLAEVLSVTRPLVSLWESGRSTPTTNDLMRMAKLFNVSTDYLLWGNGIDENPLIPKGAYYQPNTIMRVPVLGTISCGAPMLAEENIEGYIDLPADRYPGCELISLRITGNSMAGRGIINGQIAIIKIQPTANNGDMVAVCVGEAQNEATIKKIRFEDDYISLLPIPLPSNMDEYLPSIYLASQVTIIGKVVGVWFE